MTLFGLSALATASVLALYFAGPAVAAWVTPRRLAWLLITVTTMTGLSVVVVFAVAAVTPRATVHGMPWHGMINGQLTHCTLTVDASGNDFLNDCWR